MKVKNASEVGNQICPIYRRTRRAKTTPAIAWLKRLTWGDVYGRQVKRWGEVEALPSYTKVEYMARRNRRPTPVFIKRIANYKYDDHFTGSETYYYFGNPSGRFTLVNIDIDIQKTLKKGTTAGTIAFAEHLKKFWPTLYTEPSTSGKSVHGYAVLDKAGQDAAEVNAYLKRLQNWLEAEAQITNADIEKVEIKGHLPVLTREQGLLVGVKYGQFAKIPRQAEERFEELAATTVLDINKPLPKNSGPVFKLVQPRSGSCDGRFISEEEVGMIPAYEKFYENLGLVLRDDRYLVSANDFAVFCVLLRWFTDHPVTSGRKKDTLPVRKVEGLWNALHEAGTADRPFNCHRFKVIRDYLSKNRHIDWIDHRYQWTNRDAVGQVVKEGIACKWRLTGHFMGRLERVSQTGGGDFVVIEEFEKGTGEWRTPTPCPIEVADERHWLAWAEEELENWPLAA